MSSVSVIAVMLERRSCICARAPWETGRWKRSEKVSMLRAVFTEISLFLVKEWSSGAAEAGLCEY